MLILGMIVLGIAAGWQDRIVQAFGRIGLIPDSGGTARLFR